MLRANIINFHITYICRCQKDFSEAQSPNVDFIFESLEVQSTNVDFIFDFSEIQSPNGDYESNIVTVTQMGDCPTHPKMLL